MPRFKDLPKNLHPYTDNELQEKLKDVEQELKGSVLVGGPVEIKPPELIISEELSNLKAGLLEVKEDLKTIKELIDKMDRNGLKMKPQW